MQNAELKIDVYRCVRTNKMARTVPCRAVPWCRRKCAVYRLLRREQAPALRVCAQIEHNQIDLVIFLRDPLNAKSHEPDVNNVVKLCDTYNIPLATNLASAELLIKSLDRGDLEWREMYK